MHNLKSLTLEMLLQQLVVITRISKSDKSSIALNEMHALFQEDDPEKEVSRQIGSH